MLDALDDALDSGLVDETSARELTFSHALVQAAVYEIDVGRGAGSTRTVVPRQLLEALKTTSRTSTTRSSTTSPATG